MDDELRDQAERMYDVFAELARAFQYRDRGQICFYGVTISQCHALEMLHSRRSMSMSALASALFLDASTVTRIVDRLVDLGYAVRLTDTTDRRVCHVQITDQGRRLVSEIRRDLVTEQLQVLREVPVDSREAVITAMGRLLDAFRARQARSPECSGSTTDAGDAS